MTVGNLAKSIWPKAVCAGLMVASIAFVGCSTSHSIHHQTLWRNVVMGGAEESTAGGKTSPPKKNQPSNLSQAGLDSPQTVQNFAGSYDPAVQQTSYPATTGAKPKILPKAADVQGPREVTETETADVTTLNKLPIDIASVLRLAGANSRQIALAQAKIREAQANYAGAKAMWLPSISAGVGYNKHEGRLQDTRGNVLEVNRSSLFVGGGPVIKGDFPQTGGSGGPARLAVDFSLAEGIFQPLAKLQQLEATAAARDAVFNEALTQAALAYLDLAQAQGEVGVALETVKNTDKLELLLSKRVKAGLALPVDGLRAKTEQNKRRRQVFEAKEKVEVASAELARLLTLDSNVSLFPAESHAVPLPLIMDCLPLPDLIGRALAMRPETTLYTSRVQAAMRLTEQEHWRPWIPNVHLGASAGGFGGSASSRIQNFGSRYDFDALLVWQVRNLGLGNRALKRRRQSLEVQASIEANQIRDLIIAQVTSAYHQVTLRNRQIEVAVQQVKAAEKALPLNFDGVNAGELRALEALQAIDALAAARREHLVTVVNYNRGQFLLLHALGEPLVDPFGAGEDCIGGAIPQ